MVFVVQTTQKDEGEDIMLKRPASTGHRMLYDRELVMFKLGMLSCGPLVDVLSGC